MTLFASIINSLLLLYWFVPVYAALLFFNQSVSKPPNHSNCPFIAGGRFASSDRNLSKPSLRWTLPLDPQIRPLYVCPTLLRLRWMRFNPNFFSFSFRFSPSRFFILFNFDGINIHQWALFPWWGFNQADCIAATTNGKGCNDFYLLI